MKETRATGHIAFHSESKKTQIHLVVDEVCFLFLLKVPDNGGTGDGPSILLMVYPFTNTQCFSHTANNTETSSGLCPL